jgi:hypothetical protein
MHLTELPGRGVRGGPDQRQGNVEDRLLDLANSKRSQIELIPRAFRR